MAQRKRSDVENQEFRRLSGGVVGDIIDKLMGVEMMDPIPLDQGKIREAAEKLNATLEYGFEAGLKLVQTRISYKHAHSLEYAEDMISEDKRREAKSK